MPPKKPRASSTACSPDLSEMLRLVEGALRGGADPCQGWPVFSDGKWPALDWGGGGGNPQDVAVASWAGGRHIHLMPSHFVIENPAGKTNFAFPEGYQIEIKLGSMTSRPPYAVGADGKWCDMPFEREEGKRKHLAKDQLGGASASSFPEGSICVRSATIKPKSSAGKDIEQVHSRDQGSHEKADAPGPSKRSRLDLATDVEVLANIECWTLADDKRRMVVVVHSRSLDGAFNGVVKKLLQAAKEGNLEDLRSAMEGLPRSIRPDGRRPIDMVDESDPRESVTALIYAVRSGHEDVVKVLLDEQQHLHLRADVKMQTKNGSSVLHGAAYYGGDKSVYPDDPGGVRMMELLIKAGACIDLTTHDQKWAPLHNASARLNQEGFDFLYQQYEKRAAEQNVDVHEILPEVITLPENETNPLKRGCSFCRQFLQEKFCKPGRLSCANALLLPEAEADPPIPLAYEVEPEAQADLFFSVSG